MTTISAVSNSQAYQFVTSSMATSGAGVSPVGDSASGVQDTVALSDRGRELSANASADEKKSRDAAKPTVQKTENQDKRNLEMLRQLKKRDSDVRAHEQAHLAVAGRYAAGGASFSYQTGPDGVQYAVGGEVPIDMAAENTPEKTIQKMETIKRAALAPADPSSADRRIAAEASAREIQAMQELQNIQREKAVAHDGLPGSGPVADRGAADTTAVDSSISSETSVIHSRTIPGSGRHIMAKAYQDMALIA